jgi:hypothetical protein
VVVRAGSAGLQSCPQLIDPGWNRAPVSLWAGAAQVESHINLLFGLWLQLWFLENS